MPSSMCTLKNNYLSNSLLPKPHNLVSGSAAKRPRFDPVTIPRFRSSTATGTGVATKSADTTPTSGSIGSVAVGKLTTITPLPPKTGISKIADAQPFQLIFQVDDRAVNRGLCYFSTYLNTHYLKSRKNYVANQLPHEVIALDLKRLKMPTGKSTVKFFITGEIILICLVNL